MSPFLLAGKNRFLALLDAILGSHPPGVHLSYRADIDGLRALAVLSVLVFHAFPGILRGGFVGVDIFFVISGYLIGGIIFKELQSGQFDLKDFFIRRIRRIFPALLLVLISVFILGWFVLMPEELRQLGKHIAGGAGFSANLLFWREAGYFDNAAETKPLLHLWSLGVEEQFYIVWPLLLIFAWKRSFNLFSLLLLLSVLSFASGLMRVRQDAVGAFYLPFYRFWELWVGSLLAYLNICRPTAFSGAKNWLDAMLARVIYETPGRNDGSTLRDVLSLLGAMFLLVAVVTLHKQRLFPGLWAVLPVLGACLLIGAGPFAWFNRVVLARKGFVAVGLISYPLYLWHWPLLSFARILEEQTPSRWIRLGALLLSFVLALLTYWLVERPLRFGGYARFKVWLLGGAMAVMGSVGAYAWYAEGLPGRERVAVFLEQARAFQWDLKPNSDCILFYSGTSDGYCSVNRGRVEESSVVLIGDSHAQHSYPGLAEIFDRAGLGVFLLGRSSCPPFFGLETGSVGAVNNCSKWSNPALEYVLSSSAVKTVLLASRVPVYATGAGFGEVDNIGRGVRHLKLLSQPSLEDGFLIFETAIREALRRLNAAGKKVVLVVDVPELGFDPKTCVDIRPVRLREKPLQTPCAVSRQEFDARNAEYHALVTRVLADFPQVIRYDAWRAFCDERWCWGMKDGKVLYRDDDHLSLAGSHFQAEHFMREVWHRE